MILFRLGVWASSFKDINLFILGIPVFLMCVKGIFSKKFCKK